MGAIVLESNNSESLKQLEKIAKEYGISVTKITKANLERLRNTGKTTTIGVPISARQHGGAAVDGKIEQFFTALKQLDISGDWEKSLDKVNAFYDELLLTEQYELCDQYLKGFLGKDFSLLLHLGLLTITNRRKAHLQTRPELYKVTYELALSSMTPEQAKKALRNLE